MAITSIAVNMWKWEWAMKHVAYNSALNGMLLIRKQAGTTQLLVA